MLTNAIYYLLVSKNNVKVTIEETILKNSKENCYA